MLSNKLRRMGFTPSKADHDPRVKEKGDHCEHIASCVDDSLFWTRDENAILEELEADFCLKFVCFYGKNVNFI